MTVIKKQRFFAFISFILLVYFLPLAFFSCVSPAPPPENISRKIYDKGIKTPAQLSQFFLSHNPSITKEYITDFAGLYVKEAGQEGINSDVAFVQMCLETGFLQFGNLVTADMHNYCGLGAIDKEHRGEVFATEQDGIRAHIQHLHAYGTKDITLKNALIDRRYKYVNPRGKAPDIFALSSTWAADKEYGAKLDKLLFELESF